MLDITFIRENPDLVKDSLKKRGVQFDLDYLLEVDEKRRAKIKEVDDLRAKHNVFADMIAELSGEEKKQKIEEARDVKMQLDGLEQELRRAEDEFTSLMYQVPNILVGDVPEGKDESDNQEIMKWGKIPQFDFEPKDHVDIGKYLDIIDIERAAKVTGARFGYLKGSGALLEFALIRFAFERLMDERWLKRAVLASRFKQKQESFILFQRGAFIPVIPPVMIRPDVFMKMARLNPQDKDERYYLPQDDLYLIGSAEHTLGSMHMNEILDEKDLPIRYVGFSTCFRREAGSYGKDTRGMLRVHQFDKIEMESFCIPDDETSRLEQDFFVSIQRGLMEELEIPYRVVAISAGDMGIPDARQIDIEAWIPSQNKYRETHTADLMKDYQARRLNIKVRRTSGQTEFVHMNDATVLAIGRTIIAILENYQEKDGSVRIPEVLQKYMGGMERIEKKR